MPSLIRLTRRSQMLTQQSLLLSSKICRRLENESGNKHFIQMFLCYCINALSPFHFVKAKAEEELQETQSQINLLLNELSSLNQADRSVLSGMGSNFTDAASSPPEGAVALHTETLHVRLLFMLR